MNFKKEKAFSYKDGDYAFECILEKADFLCIFQMDIYFLLNLSVSKSVNF